MGQLTSLLAGGLILFTTFAGAAVPAEEPSTPAGSAVGSAAELPYWPADREARMRELAPRIRQLQQDLFKAQMAKDSAETQRMGKELSEASAEFGRLRDSMEGGVSAGGETEQR